jgi:hypothetical protein
MGCVRGRENAKIADKSNSLIRAEISLIADLHSLQGRQKIPCSGAQGIGSQDFDLKCLY